MICHATKGTVAVAVCVLALCLASYANVAGRSLYSNCVQNTDVVNATSFRGTLMAGGLFFSWNGTSAVLNAQKKCVATAMVGNQFMGANAAGQNSFTNALAAAIPPGGP